MPPVPIVDNIHLVFWFFNRHASNLWTFHGRHFIRSLCPYCHPSQAGPNITPRCDLEPEKKKCRGREQPKPSYTTPSSTFLDVALLSQNDFLTALLQFPNTHDESHHIRDVELDRDFLSILRDELDFLLPVVHQ